VQVYKFLLIFLNVLLHLLPKHNEAISYKKKVGLVFMSLVSSIVPHA
jgi:hypothetical protein